MLVPETHKIISIVEHNKPLNGYAKGVKILIGSREIVIVLDPSLDPDELKLVWDNREGYEGGEADIIFFDDTRYWGRVLTTHYRKGYEEPAKRFDTRDARKVFEEINIIL